EVGLCGIRKNLAARRRYALREVGRERALVDQLELELGGLPEQVLERLRILEARDLDDDPVVALADDRRLARAERVDTLAHDVSGALHRLCDRELEPGLGLRNHDAGVVDHRDCPVALPREAGAGGERFEDATRRIDLSRVLDQERQSITRSGNIANANARFGIAQGVSRRFLHRLDALSGDLRRFGLEQDVAPAGEVEPEIDHRARQHGRPTRTGQADQRRDSGEREEQRERPQVNALPRRKFEHFSGSPQGQSLAGLPPGGTMSPSVVLTARTLTPWAISMSAYWSSTLTTLPSRPPAVMTWSPFLTAATLA